MNAIQAVQTVLPPVQKPFSELLAHGEIRAIASRIAAAVAHFFTAIARFICSCFQSRKQLAIQAIPEQQRAAEGVNVHEGNRDQRVNAAIELLRRHQGEISPAKIKQATNEFIKYLEVFPMDAAQKQLATDALLKPRGEEGFGPLLKGEGFTLLGLPITGEEVIGRLWIFASQLKEEEQANAKRGMISALQNSYESGARVCNQGKTQRLIVAVLQGRLKDVDIDGVNIPKQISKADAYELFFTPDRREINVKTVLLQAANKFCDENPGINRQEFLVDINAYAAQAEMPET